MSIEIKTPDGGVEVVDPTSILCFREALPEEFAGTLAIKFSDGVLYADETIDTILDKLHDFPAIKVAALTPPVRPDAVWINAGKVIQVAPANGAYGQALTVIKFSLKLFQAVRESPDDARDKLAHAHGA